MTNKRLPTSQEVAVQTEEAWLDNFKKWSCIISLELHSRAGDLDESNMLVQSERVLQNSEMYAFKEVFNCNDLGFHFQMASAGKITPTDFSRSKSQRALFTLLACCNAQGTEKPFFYLSEVYSSLNCWIDGQDINLVFTASIKKAWMISSPIFDWIFQLDISTGQQMDETFLYHWIAAVYM